MDSRTCLTLGLLLFHLGTSISDSFGNDLENVQNNVVLRDSKSLVKNRPSPASDGVARLMGGSGAAGNNRKVMIDDGVVNDVDSSASSDNDGDGNMQDGAASGGSMQMSLTDQVKLLSKQLNALNMRRRDDYKMLENSLLKSITRSTAATGSDGVSWNMRKELDELRQEVKTLREGGNGNRERLTVEWLTQSIAEMRKELTELQEIASNASKDLNRRSQTFEDLATIRNDFKTVKLELEALKHRQEKTEVFVRELREEALQTEDDMRKILRNCEQANQATSASTSSASADYPAAEADHRMRHQRLLRQQVHDIEISQRAIKQQLSELQYHRIGERLERLEVEQRRLANANFNLSRQVATLDKLHGSMLELLEDVEGIQAKVDKTIPDIKREFSKLEFTSAQLNSEQSLLREEQHNAAKSLQAMAVSVSMLQDERQSLKSMQSSVDKLQDDVNRLQMVSSAHKSMLHGRIEKIESEAQPSNDSSQFVDQASNVIQQLENVESEYEAIVNKLPMECSQVNHTSPGLYLIAPAGQHRPTLAHCSNGWTSIQRRFDGSVDFNRSWESYAQGFGAPSGEFWIGNEMLHHLTSDNCTRLKVIMQDIYDNTWYALYNYFYVSSREDGYRLHVGGYSGNASDALDYQNHMQFSAIDVDRDISNTHCAANYEGGWWFSHCQHANLNGRYNLGLTWFDASRNEWIAVKSSQILINRRGSCASTTTSPSSSRSLTKDSITTTIATVV